MNTNMSADELRRWAAQCVTRMKDPLITGDEYERLIKMRDGLLAVAESQAWLEGESKKKTG
ncbi:MAG: hypothetical protein Q8M26_01490 [Pseudolabrys sp.]|nr:hypothetical protein [Pseudolabrys sp.]